MGGGDGEGRARDGGGVREGMGEGWGRGWGWDVGGSGGGGGDGGGVGVGVGEGMGEGGQGYCQNLQFKSSIRLTAPKVRVILPAVRCLVQSCGSARIGLLRTAAS